MEKLISMTDFVLEQMKNTETLKDNFVKTAAYAKFLKKPLELWMFVALDEDGNVLEEPKEKEIELSDGTCGYFTNIKDSEQYQQAKEKCLFEGFEITKDKYKSTEREFVYIPNTEIQVYRKLIYHTGETDTFFFDYYEQFRTVEDIVKYDLTLSKTAQKQIGL